MGYKYNADDLASTIAMCDTFYNTFVNENGEMSVLYAENGVLSSDYLKAKKEDFYYYRGYTINETVSGSVRPYDTTAELFRTPFNVHDDIVRPYFIISDGSFGKLLSLYIGVNSTRSDAWNFNTNRFGQANKDYSDDLYSNSNVPYRFAYIDETGSNENAEGNARFYGVNKSDSFGNYSSNYYKRYLSPPLSVALSTQYAWVYGYDLEQAKIVSVKWETNIPAFLAGDLESLKKWLDNGDRSGEIKPPSATKTDFKLWIQGLDSPTYKVNWHNTELEKNDFDFSNSIVHLKCGKHVSDGVFYHDFLNVPYTDGSVKFTWYDLDEIADTNIIQSDINLSLSVEYIDVKGEKQESGFAHVDLKERGNLFDEMFSNVESGVDGTNVNVVSYESDKDGFDSDDDDYHDPEDNTDDSQDDSTNISVSGEVCKTFQISDVELRKLSQFLWSSNFFDNVLLVNNRPIENIISLKAVIGSASTTGASQVLTLGNVASTVNVIPCAETITINVGGITIPKKYNNFLDFEPYTKVQIYLPFYGTAMLNSSLVVGRRIDISYIIDVITGTAKISIKHKNKTLYEYKTTCACDLPLTSSNRASVEMGYISSGLGMGVSLASGNVIGAVASGLSMAQSQFSSNTNGNVSGVVDFHDSRMITVMVDRPVYSDLKMFNKTHGRMCNLSKTLKNLKGYTKCADNVQIPFNCLDKEREMIIELLTSGVIL